jgi:carboxymethylenebutenolidase
VTDIIPLSAGDSTGRAYLRVPDGARAGVVVLHAWWGLNDDVIVYADRLVDAGFAVIAPDMFRGQVATEIEDAERLGAEGDAGGADTIALAAVDRLADELGPTAPLAALGWSFGAGYAIWAASERKLLSATVVYYGTYAGEFLKRSTAPLLGHFAETDPFTTDDEVNQLEAGFRDTDRPITTYRYPGTGHWFAEPSRDAYRPEAAEIAFERTVDFLRAHLQADRPVG